MVTRALSGLAAAALFALPAAAQQVEPLSEEKLALVRALAVAEVEALSQDPIFTFALIEQNAMNARLDDRRIARLDRAWTMSDSRSLVVTEMLGRQASVLLHERTEASGGKISEIILMDMKGLNAAISHHTSDLWQGDEAKWQETFLKGPGAIHYGDLKRDESTGRVQMQVSITVTDPFSNKAIGALTLAIDPERLNADAGASLSAPQAGAAATRG